MQDCALLGVDGILPMRAAKPFRSGRIEGWLIVSGFLSPGHENIASVESFLVESRQAGIGSIVQRWFGRLRTRSVY